MVVTGNPVRPEILSARRDEARARLGLDGSEPVVLVTGGSRGAERINAAALELAVAVAGWARGVLLWACGERYHGEMATGLARRLAEAGRDPGPRVRLFPYIDDMPTAYAAADLYIGRAGATTLAEITARGLPAVLIPSPHVAHHEQDANARVLEQAGAAVVIADAELTGARLVDVVTGLLAAPERLAAMARASRQLGRPDATAAIADRVLAAAGVPVAAGGS